MGRLCQILSTLHTALCLPGYHATLPGIQPPSVAAQHWVTSMCLSAVTHRSLKSLATPSSKSSRAAKSALRTCTRRQNARGALAMRRRRANSGSTHARRLARLGARTDDPEVRQLMGGKGVFATLGAAEQPAMGWRAALHRRSRQGSQVHSLIPSCGPRIPCRRPYAPLSTSGIAFWSPTSPHLTTLAAR